MPTNLFFKLQEEKQEKILMAAKKEFSQYSYFNTSINRIVKDAEISRGSFYQYFADKDDLFFYIFDKCVKEPLMEKYMGTIGQPKDLFQLGLHFFDTLVEIMLNKESFLTNIITTVNIEQIRYLMEVKRSGKHGKDEDFQLPTEEKIGEMVDLEPLNYENIEELIFIIEAVKSTVVSGIMAMVMENRSQSVARERLQVHFEVLKRGFLK